MASSDRIAADETLRAIGDPALLRNARQLYLEFCSNNPRRVADVRGVAIDRHTYRGQILFRRPVLLAWEFFIPVQQLQAETFSVEKSDRASRSTPRSASH